MNITACAMIDSKKLFYTIDNMFIPYTISTLWLGTLPEIIMLLPACLYFCCTCMGRGNKQYTNDDLKATQEKTFGVFADFPQTASLNFPY